MKTPKLPRTDSIQELATFWDTHDLTDFQEELEEVTEQVFAQDSPIKVPLQSSEAEAVRQIAESKGVSPGELIREWIRQRLLRGKKGRGPTKRCS